MPWKLTCAVAAALLLGAASAQASDATVLADRAGFLVGHAHRCGVDNATLRRSEALVDRLIAAFARDDGDAEAAQARFAERALAAALGRRQPDRRGEPLPSCAAVRGQLALLNQHFAPAAYPGNHREGAMARKRSDAKPARASATKPAKSTKPATIRSEELTPERRAALELKRAARRMRGKPPSI